jgi:hypothetical protein
MRRKMEYVKNLQLEKKKKEKIFMYEKGVNLR